MGWTERERLREREEEETTKTAGVGNMHSLFLCVLHCCTTEALGSWICNSTEDSDSKEAVHSLCVLGF